MKGKILLLGLIFLMIIPIVFSTSNSFETWTNDISLCKCGISSQTVNIFNYGDDSVFSILLEGNAASWSSLSQNNIFLKSGTSGTLTINYNVPCNANSEKIKITVSSIKNEKQELNSNLIVGKCENTIITPIKIFSKKNPCENLDYSFKVKNIGNFRETYNFKISKYNDYFKFSPSQVSLNPNQEITVLGQMRLPCSKFGNHTFNINIISERNNEKNYFKNYAEINHAYDFAITSGEFNSLFKPQTKVYETCINQKYNIPILIENKANLNNRFYLDLDGKYAYLNENKIILKSNSNKIINISYNPKKEGNYYLFLTTKTELGKDISKIKIPVKVSNCYDLDIPVKEIKKSNSIIKIPIENIGTKTVEANIKLLKNKYSKLESDKLIVKNKTILNLYTDPSVINKVDKITLAFQLNNGEILKKRINIVFGKPFFYTYKNYIIIGIILLILLICLIKYRIKKNKENYDKKRKNIDKIILNIKKNVDEEIIKENKNTKKIKEKNKKNKFLNYLILTILLIIIFTLIIYVNIHYIPIFNNSVNHSNNNINSTLLNQTNNSTLNSSLSETELTNEFINSFKTILLGKIIYFVLIFFIIIILIKIFLINKLLLKKKKK